MPGKITLNSASDFQKLLRRLTGLSAELNPVLVSQVEMLLSSVGRSSHRESSDVESNFYGRMNDKLGANRDAKANLYAAAAKEGYTFNFPQKKRISRAIDEIDLKGLAGVLTSAKIPRDIRVNLLSECKPISKPETQILLREETSKPSKLRKKMARAVDADVFASAAGSLIWALWSEESLYKTFGGAGAGNDARSYIAYLQQLNPELFQRDRTLAIRFTNPGKNTSRGKDRRWLQDWLSGEYAALANHGFLALVVDAANSAQAWRLVNDATLFAERFREVKLKQMFFRSSDVAAETNEYIHGISQGEANFDVLNEGFTYRDVFVLTDSNASIKRLVLVFQKNARDETRIPCPACRSTDIEGNSYPSFGVRSWECRNNLCPNRSIYNRGNRFQFRSVIQQAAIEDPNNTIPVENVNRWRRDILPFDSDEEIIDTLVRHYSLAGDGIAVMDASCKITDCHGRRLTSSTPKPNYAGDFWSSSFFARFLVPAAIGEEMRQQRIGFPRDSVRLHEIIEGDSTAVLRGFDAEVFDRAITSPPYFNARAYAQWPNLYCYLNDMYMNAREVFRTLRAGGIYAYNIFDYFDNERIVTFSDMGKKRIPLGALMAHVLEQAGFELVTVMPWDKGDIQGKRGFNGGNYSPYYQAPFNCWEHVLIMRKTIRGLGMTAAQLPLAVLSSTIRVKPVFKMVRGQNTYGHTAPFPEALVDVLLDGLEAGSTVLDPYAGSATTARAASRRGISSIMIERNAEYVALASRLLEESTASLFGE